jgi:hypothetical protein
MKEGRSVREREVEEGIVASSPDPGSIATVPELSLREKLFRVKEK